MLSASSLNMKLLWDYKSSDQPNPAPQFKDETEHAPALILHALLCARSYCCVKLSMNWWHGAVTLRSEVKPSGSQTASGSCCSLRPEDLDERGSEDGEKRRRTKAGRTGGTDGQKILGGPSDTQRIQHTCLSPSTHHEHVHDNADPFLKRVFFTLIRPSVDTQPAHSTPKPSAFLHSEYIGNAGLAFAVWAGERSCSEVCKPADQCTRGLII